MPKLSLSSQDARDPLQEAADAFAEHLGREIATEDVQQVYCKETNRGLYVSVKTDEDYRFMVVRIKADGVTATELTANDLGQYSFDPTASAVPDATLYKGLLAEGDLAIWLGREKHRKSNLILQFAISAALGRDFIGFNFAASKPLTVMLIDFESKNGSLRQRYDGIVTAMKLNATEQALLRQNLRILEVRRIRKEGRAFPKFPHNPKLPNKPNQDARFWEELVTNNPADVYIIDPLRTLHAADENDSTIETLLSELQRVFRGAAVVVAHHMRKSNENSIALADDMRAWSEGARGSSAIKAHSDVIVLQERSMNPKGEEVVHLGVFLKDGADVEPFPLMESDHQSFYWEPVAQVPPKLQAAYDALSNAGGIFKDKAMAADIIKNSANVSRATAYRHFNDLIRSEMVIENGGGFRLQKVAT